MIQNKIRSLAGVSVGASAVDTTVSAAITPTDPWNAQVTVKLSAATEATGITFKLKDSFDGGATYFPVGSESQVSLVKKAFTAGTRELSTITFPDEATVANNDYLDMTAKDTTTWAVALSKPVAEVQTLTFPDKATATHQDFVVVETAAGVKYAVALTKPVASIDTINFADKASTTAGDYVVTYDATGLAWAGAMNVSGADPAPSGAIWTAIPAGRKVNINISSATNDEDIAALYETAMNALTGYSAAFTTDDTAADGNILVTRDTKGPTTAPVVKSADDSGAGSITASNSTTGVASAAPSGPIWTAATYKGLADISADTTAAQVAARAETALNALTGFTAAITSNDTAADGTMILTQATYGSTVNPVVKDAPESGAGSITGVQTTAGTSPTSPSGAIWTAVDAARKVVVNIFGLSTAAAICTAAVAALSGLTGFSAAFTITDVLNGTATLRQVLTGTVADPAPHNTGDSGAGSIAVLVDAAGSNGTTVNTSTNAITVTSHGWTSGTPVVPSGAGTPGGLSTTTIYYVIYVDANTVKLAATQAEALAGTPAVDITDYGYDTCHLVQSLYEIRMYGNDATDLAQLPLWESVVVVANTGSGDACTVAAIYWNDLPVA